MRVQAEEESRKIIEAAQKEAAARIQAAEKSCAARRLSP